MSGFPQRVKELVLARSSGMCEVMVDNLCTFHAVDLQHRRARGSGGSKRVDTNTAANCLACCRACHRYAESRAADAEANGWVIPNNRRPPINPASVRVLWRKQWRYLDEQGGLHQQPPSEEGVA